MSDFFKDADNVSGCTKITPSMVINGNVNSSDNLLIEGQVFGDITTTGDLTSSNLTVGNIAADNASFVGARVKGDAALTGSLNVGENTIMIGNVSADTVTVAGKIRGNLDVAGAAELADTALVAGNITASSVSTNPGARINGTISTHAKDAYLDLDKEFDLGGDF